VVDKTSKKSDDKVVVRPTSGTIFGFTRCWTCGEPNSGTAYDEAFVSRARFNRKYRVLPQPRQLGLSPMTKSRPSERRAEQKTWTEAAKKKKKSPLKGRRAVDVSIGLEFVLPAFAFDVSKRLRRSARGKSRVRFAADFWPFPDPKTRTEDTRRMRRDGDGVPAADRVTV